MNKGAEIYMDCIMSLQNQNNMIYSLQNRQNTDFVQTSSYYSDLYGFQYTKSAMALTQTDSRLSLPMYFTYSNSPWNKFQPIVVTDSHLYSQFGDQMPYAAPYQVPVSNRPLVSPYSIASSTDAKKLWQPWSDDSQSSIAHTIETDGCAENIGWMATNVQMDTNEPMYEMGCSSAVKHQAVGSQSNLGDNGNPSVQKSPGVMKKEAAKKDKILRPMNSFMIFAKRNRSHVHELHSHCDNRSVSKILSDTWYSLEFELRKPYIDLALDMKKKHFELFPGYKWRRSKQGKDCSTNANVATPNDVLMSSDVDSLKSPGSESMASVGSDSSRSLQLNPTPTPTRMASQYDISKAKKLMQSYFQKRYRVLPIIDHSKCKFVQRMKASAAMNTVDAKKKGAVAKKYRTQYTKRMPDTLVGQRFFGPDFNAHHIEDASSTSSYSPMSITPTTADSIPMTTRKFRESRETYMQRKAVITEIFRTKSIFPTEQETDAIMAQHPHLFGTKSYLNAKIREYRQKYMNQRQPKTA